MSATGDARPRACAGDPEAGTTLAEALVVIAITVAIGAIVFPALLQGVGGAAFAEAATGVRADLRMARAQALSTSRTVDVVVAEDGRSYGWTPGPQRALVAGLSMSPTGEAMRFYPDGSASGGTLALANARSQARFEVDATTGVAVPQAARTAP